jgi:ankyrin repeat protein
LAIARLVGDPPPHLAARIVSAAVAGVEYGFQYLSDTHRQSLLEKYLSQTKRSFGPAMESFFLSRVTGRPALIPAARFGDIEKVKHVLAEDKTGDLVNILTAGGTALTAAAVAGNEEMIRFLLSVPGIDAMMPNLSGESPFVLACGHARPPA